MRPTKQSHSRRFTGINRPLIYTVMLCLAAFAVLHGLSPAVPADEGSLSLRVSRDFGRPPLLEKSVPFSGVSVLRVLEGAAAVETSFGGAFVRGINGLEAGKGRDWFYYVNGSLASVGAARLIPRAGDSIWWDIHRWKGTRNATAVIGDYPRPFVSLSREGGPATLIVYDPGLEDTAAEMKRALEKAGARGISMKPLSDDRPPVSRAILFLGPWEKLRGNALVNDLYLNAEKCGIFVGFGKGGLSALSPDGSPRGLFPRAAALFAVKTGVADVTPVWFVTGTDPESARAAARVLVNSPERISGYAAAVVHGTTLLPLPVTDEKSTAH